MKEEMVPVKFPNGYVTEMRKSLADSHIKNKLVVRSTAEELASYRGQSQPKPEKPAAGKGTQPPVDQTKPGEGK